MCGIAGVAMKSGRVDPELLQRVSRRLRHRGPDDDGMWLNPTGSVGLAHRRLAIIDPSPLGHQPMCYPDRAAIVFNGEIYNFQDLRRQLEDCGHTFHSQTDTEVLLNAYRHWGEDCLGHLNGMFAFAIYDPEKRCIFLARDRLGKKPLYYLHEDRQFAFASEGRALIPVNSRGSSLNLKALNFYFALGYVPGGHCIFAGLKKLPPGHCLSFDLESWSARISRYWRIPRLEDGPHQDEQDLLEEMAELLEDSVRLRLFADVPLGIWLSGGTDSSMVTAMAARVSRQRVKTFHISFPGSPYDERGFARTVAEYFDTEHYELPMSFTDESILPLLAGHIDEPLADSSLLPTYHVARLTRQHVTVALGGDGGDELFGGYHWYRRGLRVLPILQRLPAWLRRPVARSARRWLPPGLPGRGWLGSLGGDLCEHRKVQASMFDLEARGRLFSRELLQNLDRELDGPERYLRNLWPQDRHPLEQMSALDLQTFLPDDILFKVDRASMAVGLEVRAPLLDYRMAEFAFGRVPPNLKVNNGDFRILQHRLASRLLPANLDLNRKQGFSMPMDDWFAGPWSGTFAARISHLDRTGWFNPDFLQKLAAIQRLRGNNGYRLYACLMFSLWLEGLST
jgi:asparagine synthase (glutamine-hydrolysing)